MVLESGAYMVVFVILMPIAVTCVLSFLFARYIRHKTVAALIFALVAVAITFALLRSRYTLFEIGPFMLLPQALGFVLASISGALIVRKRRANNG